MPHPPVLDDNGFPECCPLPQGHPDHMPPESPRAPQVEQQATEGHRDGVTYVPAMDEKRLNAQGRRVWRAMADQEWHTLEEIAAMAQVPLGQSLGARVRDFRKPEFGGHAVERRKREGQPFEYRLIVRVHAVA